MVRKNKYKKLLPLAPGFLKKKYILFLALGLTFSLLVISLSTLSVIYADKNSTKDVLGKKIQKIKESTNKIAVVTVKIPQKTPTPTPTFIPTNTPTPTKKIIPTFTPTPTINQQISGKQYTAEKVGESTYKVAHTFSDNSMASSNDIYNALNSYRGSHGASSLLWDDKLISLANERVNTFVSNSSLDSHAGFRSYMDNDGFSKAGFNGLGENSAQLAGNLNGDRIIKEIFGADADHDGNQLDPSWTHVGIAVNGNFINVNFGKGKR